MLSTAYTSHLTQLKRTLAQMPRSEKEEIGASSTGAVSLTPYDFHAVVKTDGEEAVKYDFTTGLKEVVQSMDHYGWTAIDPASGQMIEEQQGVFRVNCLDWYASFQSTQEPS
jgi:hypothetical protein